MTEEERQLTVYRLCHWLTILSDFDRLADLSEACMAEMYAANAHRTVGAELQRRSEMRARLWRALWRRPQDERKRMLTRAAEFAGRVVGAEWARPQLLKRWMELARQWEAANAGAKAGRPKWATGTDYEAAGIVAAS